MGNRLNDFCKLVWNENGMEFIFYNLFQNEGAELLLNDTKFRFDKPMDIR